MVADVADGVVVDLLLLLLGVDGQHTAAGVVLEEDGDELVDHDQHHTEDCSSAQEEVDQS